MQLQTVILEYSPLAPSVIGRYQQIEKAQPTQIKCRPWSRTIDSRAPLSHQVGTKPGTSARYIAGDDQASWLRH